MPRRSAPSARSRKLALVLRQFRRDADLSATAVARRVGMSGPKITRIETCETGVYLDDLEKLLDFYRVTSERRTELLDLARHAEQRAWLRMNNPNLPADWQAWTDFEDEASSIHNYEPLGVPGLLQTPEYAAEIVRATGVDLNDDTVDALVASRMARQGVLTRTTPVCLHAIIEESVLHRPLATPETFVRQLRALVEASERRNVTIQVLPTAVGVHPGVGGSFVLLDYDGLASLVWLESKISSLLVDEEEPVAVYQRTWSELVKLALDEQDSAELLRARVAAV